MRIWKICMLFYTGGATYLTIELLFRGRSYGSMFLAGGLCFLLIGQMNHVSPRLPLILRGIVGSLIRSFPRKIWIWKTSWHRTECRLW